ncbi:Dynein regulatory complex subunit 2 [Merluccius polli]|uniref:Dynein regulatory complex subunit 2 n=1 Tax=Merluccius polli TaxID=89951 RepID=A0AA47P305_MERPO|nr:Dynein regulatory complex subunit 2 [Merluccius polli]
MQGEKILRRAEMCRKFETEHEKVLPFYTSSLTTEEQTQEKLKAMEPPSEELARAMLDYADLARFWQRYNKVLLERLCFEKEKDVLTQENQQLQALLRQYMDGISVSDEILRRRNPLLIVSQPTLALATGTERQRKQHTVIEAAHVIQHTL